MTVESPTSDTVNQPALTLQRSTSLLKHRAASADGRPQDVVCRWQGFLTVTFLSPLCHSLIPSIQLTDELPLRRHSLSQCSTKQASQSSAKVSGLLRERLQWLGLVVNPFSAFTEVTRRCQIWADNWSIWKLWRWQALSPLRVSPRMGQGRNTNNFIPHFLGNTSLQISTMWGPQIWQSYKSNKGLLCCLGVERNTG